MEPGTGEGTKEVCQRVGGGRREEVEDRTCERAWETRTEEGH